MDPSEFLNALDEYLDARDEYDESRRMALGLGDGAPERLSNFLAAREKFGDILTALLGKTQDKG